MGKLRDQMVSDLLLRNYSRKTVHRALSTVPSKSFRLQMVLEDSSTRGRGIAGGCQFVGGKPVVFVPEACFLGGFQAKV